MTAHLSLFYMFQTCAELLVRKLDRVLNLFCVNILLTKFLVFLYVRPALLLGSAEKVIVFAYFRFDWPQIFDK